MLERLFLQTRGISTPKLHSQLNATSRRSDVINKSTLRDNCQKYQECETALWKIHRSRLVKHITPTNRHCEFVILGRPLVFEGPFATPNNDKGTQLLRHTLDHEK